MKEITIQLPEKLAERITAWATMTNQDMSDMVETALDATFPDLLPDSSDLEALSDEDLVATAQIQMDKAEGERLSDLQAKQREGDLTEAERDELFNLFQRYNALWLRQSQALAITVSRGLLPPMSA